MFFFYYLFHLLSVCPMSFKFPKMSFLIGLRNFKCCVSTCYGRNPIKKGHDPKWPLSRTKFIKSTLFKPMLAVTHSKCMSGHSTIIFIVCIVSQNKHRSSPSILHQIRFWTLTSISSIRSQWYVFRCFLPTSDFFPVGYKGLGGWFLDAGVTRVHLFRPIIIRKICFVTRSFPVVRQILIGNLVSLPDVEIAHRIYNKQWWIWRLFKASYFIRFNVVNDVQNC